MIIGHVRYNLLRGKTASTAVCGEQESFGEVVGELQNEGLQLTRSALSTIAAALAAEPQCYSDKAASKDDSQNDTHRYRLS